LVYQRTSLGPPSRRLVVAVDQVTLRCRRLLGVVQRDYHAAAVRLASTTAAAAYQPTDVAEGLCTRWGEVVFVGAFIIASARLASSRRPDAEKWMR